MDQDIKYKPVIVVAAYNRAESLKRLLTSLSNITYQNNVDLIISIDGGGPKEVSDIAENFFWRKGEKNIIKHKQNIGLKNHIISIGNLTYKYNSIILLEDDLIVSPWFYEYVIAATNFYASESAVAGISLYAYRNNENADCAPFIPLNNGYDTYFLQVPSSWGQVWTKSQWDSFRSYYEKNKNIVYTDRIPENVKGWADTSWKKYFYKYMVERDKYFVTPYISYSSNCGDEGTHSNKKTTLWQAQLSYGVPNTFRFPVYGHNCIRYDAYMEIYPECLPMFSNIPISDLCIDLYGSKPIELFDNKYWLTIKSSSSPIKSFGMELLPIESNILYNQLGGTINLAKRETLKDVPQETLYNLSRLYSYYAFQYGIREGYKRVKNTKTYKLGKVFSKPLDLMRKEKK